MTYICDVCEGVGRFLRIYCTNCDGTGKVDWVKNITGRSSISHIFLWACINGNLKKVKYLVEHGADIHVNDDQALEWADYNGHLEFVKYIEDKILNEQDNNDHNIV